MDFRVSEIRHWLDTRDEKFFLFLIVVFTGIWSLLTFNKTAPVTEGWFTVYADLILSGKMPYSDFELTFTPLYTYFTAGVNAVFGDHLIVWRVIGSVLFVLTGVLAFKLFRLFFPTETALLSALVSVMFLFAEGIFISYDYVYFFNFVVFLLSYLLLKVLGQQEEVSMARQNLNLLLIGILAGLSFWLRQSTGLILIVYLLIFLLVVAKFQKQYRVNYVNLLAFLTGVAIPILALLAIFAAMGVLDSFIHMMFFSGSKGSFVVMLTGFLVRIVEERWIFMLIGIGFALFTLFFRNAEKRDPAVSRTHHELILIVACMLFLLLTMFLRELSEICTTWVLGPMDLCAIVFSFICAYFLVVLVKGLNSVRLGKEIEPGRMSILFFAGILFVIAFGGGTSADVTFRHCFMCFGLLTGMLILKIRELPKKELRLALDFIIIGAVVCTLVSTVCVKENNTYVWFTIDTESYFAADNYTDIDYFAGIKLTDTEKYVYEDFVSICQTELSDSDLMYVYAATPVFYTLAHKLPFVTAPVPWFDVSSDDALYKDLDTVKAVEPKLLVFADHGEDAMNYEEKLYRNGEPSGQRAMYEWLQSCMTDPGSQYTVIGEYFIQNYPIYVMVHI